MRQDIATTQIVDQRPDLTGLPTRPIVPAWIREGPFFVAALVLPFVVNPWGLQVFDLPKAVLLRVLLAIAVITAVRDARLSPPTLRSWTRLARTRTALADPRVWVWVFGAISCAATAIAIEPGAALWGDFQRQDGLVTSLTNLAFFLLIATRLGDWRSVERLSLALTLGSMPVVLYGMVQAAGLDPIAWQTIDKSPIISTLGRSNHVGSYFAMIIPIAVVVLLSTKSRLLRAAIFLDVASALCLLVLTEARSAWLGLATALLTILVLPTMKFAGGSAPSATRAVKRAVTVVVAATTLVVVSSVAVTCVSLPAERPLDSILLAPITSGSFGARLVIWRESVRLIAERPLLGWGPDCFALAFHHVYPPELVFTQGREVITDRAHNLLLHQAVSTGLLGLSAYLLLLGTVAHSLLRSLRHAPTHNRALAVAMLAAWLGHVADLLLSFDVAGTAVVYWTIAGAGVGLSGAAAGSHAAADSSRGSVISSSADISRFDYSRRRVSSLRVLSQALAVLIAAVALSCGIASLVADTVIGLSLEPATSSAERLSDARLAVQIWPFEPEYRTHVGSLHFDRAKLESNPIRWLMLAESSLRDASVLRPSDPYNWLPLADVLSYRAVRLGEQDSLMAAEFAYDRAISLAPTTATLYVAAARSELAMVRNDLAIARLERATKLDPTNAEAWDLVSGAYQSIGRANDAAQASEVARALRNVPRDDAE